MFLLLLSLTGQADQTDRVVQLQTLQQVHSGWESLLHINNGKLSGRFRELIDCSFDKIPFQVSYGFGPFSRIQRQVQNQQADGYFPANLTTKRLIYSTPSTPLIDDYKVLIRNKSVAPTRQLRIAAMRGATQELDIAKRYSDFVYPITNYNQLVAMLNAGRVDAIVGSQLFFSVTEGFNNIGDNFITERLESSSMRAFFSNDFLRKNPKFLNQFNYGLKLCLSQKLDRTQAPELSESVRETDKK